MILILSIAAQHQTRQRLSALNISLFIFYYHGMFTHYLLSQRTPIMVNVLQSTTASCVAISRPISAVMEKCFGVIADIQHADVEDGCDFRYFVK